MRLDLDDELRILFGTDAGRAHIDKMKKGIETQNASVYTLINKQYKKMALRHHPDRGGDAEEFNKLTNAIDNIKARYDSGSQSQSSMESTKMTEEKYDFAIDMMSHYKTSLEKMSEVIIEPTQENLTGMADLIELAQGAQREIEDLASELSYQIPHDTLEIFELFKIAQEVLVDQYQALAQKEKQRASGQSRSPTTVTAVPSSSAQKHSPFETEIELLKELSQNITRILNTNATPALDELSVLEKKLTGISRQLKITSATICMKIEGAKTFGSDNTLTKEENSVIEDVKKKLSTALNSVKREIENANKRKAEAAAKAAAEKAAAKKAAAEAAKKTTKKTKKTKKTEGSKRSSSRTTSQTHIPKDHLGLIRTTPLADVNTALQEDISQALTSLTDQKDPRRHALEAAQKYLQNNHATMQKGYKKHGLKETIKLFDSLIKTSKPNLVTGLLNTWATAGKTKFICGKAPRRQFAAEALAEIQTEQQESPPVHRHQKKS